VAVEGGDLLAHDDVDPQLRMPEGEVARPQRPQDVVVVGERDDVEPPCGGPHDGLGRLGAVAPERVNVEVGPARRQGAAQASAQRGAGPLGRETTS
jgi:hypothetical protein